MFIYCGSVPQRLVVEKMNYAIYPCKVMRITQNYTGKTSHKPHTTGAPKDYPIDEGCKDAGREYFYCPCDEMVIRRIYGVGTKGTNTLWLESSDKVDFADGTRDYLTVMVIHPEDGDMKKLSVGDSFRRKERIVREGKDGATGNHLHISAGKGKVEGSGWVQNTKGKWVLTTTKGAAVPEKLFYVDPAFTKVMSKGGIAFKELPPYYTAGSYKVNTAVLNIRKGPGTNYKKAGTLIKGKKIRVTEVYGIWGRYTDGKWVSLEYCRKV